MVDRLVLAADLDELGRARSFVRERAQAAGFPPAATGEIGLAVTEAVSNVIRHAYGGDATQQLVLEVTVDDRSFVIEVVDQGQTPDGLPEQDPDLDDPSDGGYGVYLMRTVMDDVQLLRQDRGNVLRMCRARETT